MNDKKLIKTVVDMSMFGAGANIMNDVVGGMKDGVAKNIAATSTTVYAAKYLDNVARTGKKQRGKGLL